MALKLIQALLNQLLLYSQQSLPQSTGRNRPQPTPSDAAINPLSITYLPCSTVQVGPKGCRLCSVLAFSVRMDWSNFTVG